MDYLTNVISKLFSFVFDGIFELITQLFYSIIFGVADVFNRSVTDVFSTNLTWFNSTFPMVKQLQTIIISMAISLALLSCVWQLFRSIGGNIVGDVEEPWIIIVRLFIYVLLIVYSQDLCNIALKFATVFYTSMNTSKGDASSWVSALRQLCESGKLVPDSQNYAQIANESGATEAIFNLIVGFLGWFFETFLAIVLIIPIIWNYFKLLLEAAERYVTMCVMYYAAPLALAMGVSKSTSNVTKSWTRMYGASLLMLILNTWSLKLISSAIATSSGMIIASNGNYFIWCLTVYGFLKVAQHLDEYLSAMGLSVAKTGGNLLDDAMSTISTVSHAKDMITGKKDKKQTYGQDGSTGAKTGMGGPSVAYSRNGNAPQITAAPISKAGGTTGVPLGTGTAYMADGKQIAKQIGEAVGNKAGGGSPGGGSPTNSSSSNVTGKAGGQGSGNTMSSTSSPSVPFSPNANRGSSTSIPNYSGGSGFGGVNTGNNIDSTGGLGSAPSDSQVGYKPSENSFDSSISEFDNRFDNLGATETPNTVGTADFDLSGSFDPSGVDIGGDNGFDTAINFDNFDNFDVEPKTFDVDSNDGFNANGMGSIQTDNEYFSNENVVGDGNDSDDGFDSNLAPNPFDDDTNADTTNDTDNDKFDDDDDEDDIFASYD